MSHCDAVADPDYPEFERNPPSRRNAFVHFLRKLPQMSVAGDNGIVRIGNSNKREIHFPVSHPERTQERSIWRPLISGFYVIAAHVIPTFNFTGDRFAFLGLYVLGGKNER
jgi:hypothetical protein